MAWFEGAVDGDGEGKRGTLDGDKDAADGEGGILEGGGGGGVTEGGMVEGGGGGVTEGGMAEGGGGEDEGVSDGFLK